ncbi:XdhC family protein [Brevibacterium luteolum]|uniref:XshC-Cox1 family protein n=1 Tax=Brevibacterium luteolum TaxID=199591 RepID=A0A2N6PJK7_9MICO|nr:XdhC/CoxI family protein [Brevibacterium luteolum]PMB98880.1 XshC-Cox1 family protein [Brevibacterium luteolum]
MRDIASDILDLLTGDEPFAVCTVIRTWSSAPRPAGTAMAVTASGRAIGSLSGGCVEGAVYAAAQLTIDDGQPRLGRYGVSDDEAFAVGLACGGRLDVLIRRVDPADPADTEPLAATCRQILLDEPAALLTRIPLATDDLGEPTGMEYVLAPPAGRWLAITAPEADAPTVTGSLGDGQLDCSAVDSAVGLLAAGTTQIREYGEHGERLDSDTAVLISAFSRKPRMLIFGAIDYARALAAAAKLVGYHVTVCDARPVFATPARFPEADEVVVSWPHRYLQAELDAGRVEESTAIAVLTHDLKFDVPLLQVALGCPAAYVGAMGSRRTNDRRIAALRDAGLPEELIDRLYAPIGLDLGARTPETTAISILAEITRERWQASGAPLRDTTGPIHS